ncbi:serine/arginine repetitive matrix protein 1-like [Rhinolophus ferrumequinum]|uniref:serine/arginine repetitive matrix protein 1-like n=1 Tax=Rhinolophus ferrumequinum TaxID=59479 RepID=UPI00140FCDC3|nr:serine/arginine repetitive matrix protein 1-like [Rhinolophus ferrumequinum]XP_032987046.1 serine/arginine repetitive matrix protein 1-like [Rhinolophus ferrumequinum]XP_032987047.1 serine/arginine repetitive matrix protein 1-like [Rhinolophus ferrumequinum]XP_032987048.1 serine/arginine repetitive matrix protein 1-like [Rhinolophus ferrumequinum]
MRTLRVDASPDSYQGSPTPFPPRTQLDGGTPGCLRLSALRARSCSSNSQQGPLPTPGTRSLNPALKAPAFLKGTSRQGGRQCSPESLAGRGRWTRRGEVQGAGEGRLPTWGLTPAARQRRLDPGAIKPVHGERGGAAAAPASVQTASSRRVAARPPPAPAPLSPALLPQLTLPWDPSLSGCAQRPQSTGPTPKRPSDSARAPGGPIAHPPRPA